MSEAPRSVDTTPPPEDPAWVKTVRWLWHHFRGEGQIIRKAPVATIVIWGVLTYGSYWYLSAHYAERLDNLTTANTALQATVGQLQNELKGASPQLAAMQARRAAVRDKLLEFYVAVGPLIDEKIPAFGIDKKAMDEAMSSLQQHATQWTNETAMFLQQNLGPAARDRFLDVSNMPIYGYDIGGEYTELKNALSNRRKNLSLLIETAAYDR
jgi:hypothetical protein